MAHTLKFGSYTFPSGFDAASLAGGQRLATIEVPRRDGIAVGTPQAKERIIQIAGVLYSTSMQSARDALLAAIYTGRQKLYLETDRYIYATLNGYTDDYTPGAFDHFCNVAMDFLCDSPFFEADTESDDTYSSPVSGVPHDIEVGGNAYAVPAFEITISGTGTLDIEIAIGSDSFTLQGAVTSGDVIVVDSLDETVTLQADGSDKMSLFEGKFLTLVGDATNSLTYTHNSGTPTVSAIVTTWRNRWR